jgi:hypothetical protein
MGFNKLSDNRYYALEETRMLLGFKKSEWKSLLVALSKTDNGWFEFMQGEFRITIEKFVDINELHMQIRSEKKGVEKALTYSYDLAEFTQPRN